MNVQDALAIGVEMLRGVGIDDPVRDARKLMAACLGIEQGRLTLHLHEELEAVPEAVFFADISERREGKPISQLLGWRDFYGYRFELGPEVLDPRPDTETLVDAALSQPFSEVLDLGTGSGCILLTLLAERPEAIGIGTDISASALALAHINSSALEVENRCALIESNWFDAVGGRYDLIVSNPPYIAVREMADLQPELSYEPRIALTDERDGLSAYRIIVPGAGAHLVPGGRLLVEIGWQQGAAVSEMFKAAGFDAITVIPDLDGRDRVVSGVWPK
ncbi:peptide chain release factor N(5)-glutamine methyltransferase [Roseovarius sp. 2305UL8-3]|uniref:peptide chain release factor N(5)-glutamine methyltransferase n=1 Tax=Roseovarius conchicola TaxID=3121636 RepID=UPI00352986AB